MGMAEDVIDDLRGRIGKTLEDLKLALAKVRTGRANPALLDAVRVDYYGTQAPLQQVANVTVADPRLIVVKPWEKSMISPIEKAINAAGLGVNAMSDAEIVRVPIPPLTEERRREYVKIVKTKGEEHKIAIRNERRDAKEMIEQFTKDGGDPATFRTGNRDTGVAIRSTQLAKLLGKILRDDMKLVKATPQLLRRLPRPTVFLVERAPKKQPAKLFPSLKLNLESRLTVQPVLSPDNYMDTVPALLRKAKKSILIEQQYIRADEKKHPNVAVLLDAIAEARQNNPRLDVRIVLGKVFSAGDLDKEHTNLDTLRDKYNLKLGANIRYINTDQLVHCHNKMVVIDGAGVLVSSQNWSDTAVTKNREAGLWLPQAQVAKYFGEIFETDWKAAFKSPDTGVSRTRRATPQSLREGGFVKVVLADYEEV